MKVLVEIYIEEMYSDSREKAITGTFSLAAIGDDKLPVSVK